MLESTSYINKLFGGLSSRQKTYSPIETRRQSSFNELVEDIVHENVGAIEPHPLISKVINDYTEKYRHIPLEVSHKYFLGFVPRYAIPEFVGLMFGVILSLTFIVANMYVGRVMVVTAFTATLVGSMLGIVFMIVTRRR